MRTRRERFLCGFVVLMAATCLTRAGEGELLLFFDAFDDVASGWESRSWDEGGYDYRDGEFAIWINEPNWSLKTWAPLARMPDGDFTIDVVVYRHSGEGETRYGLFWGTDNDNHYQFLCTTGGSYAVNLRRGGAWEESPVSWTPSDHLRQGGEINELRVVATGGQVRLEANGVLLATFESRIDGPQRVGITTGARQSPPNEVRFVSFSVFDPSVSGQEAPSQAESEYTKDFGDAAGAGHATLLVDDGAWHEIDGIHHLGVLVDGEADGQPNDNATGDDLTGERDDDGVWFTSSLQPGMSCFVVVEASAAGYLNAWLDGDADGAWDSTEQVFFMQPLNAGFNALTFTVPGTAIEGTTVSRFRFSREAMLSFDGGAPDGEVEDHWVRVCPTYVVAIATDKRTYVLGEEMTVKIYVNRTSRVELIEERRDGSLRVLWSGDLEAGTQRLVKVPATDRIGAGRLAVIARADSGDSTMVSTPYIVEQP